VTVAARGFPVRGADAMLNETLSPNTSLMPMAMRELKSITYRSVALRERFFFFPKFSASAS
jgi:hypothetical protein